MQKHIKKAIELLSGLALSGKKNPSVIPRNHTKSDISKPESPYFKRVSPEKCGISPMHLVNFLTDLENEARANVHNLMVIKDGKVILDVSAPGYDTNTYHLSHSMTKTVTGIAIGLLVDEGKLDINSKACDYFPDVTINDPRVRNITIEHLLTMRSGIPFSELGTATETKWTESFFSDSTSFAPGEKFQYNSLNSYILARIAVKVSGQGLTEYLKPRLFDPLGIDNFFWEKSPEGYEKGGFGLYMSCESWAKIGVMLLEMGMFEGHQILSRSWILRSITERSVAPEDAGAFNYGYHIWVSRSGDDFLLNGMLGQNVWICPKNKLVVAINSGNGELFQGSPMLDIVREYLNIDLPAPAEPHKEARALKSKISEFFTRRHQIRIKSRLHGLGVLFGLKNPTPFDEKWSSLLGEYAFIDNNTGLLPVFVQVMQNNFPGGIERMELRRTGDSLILICTEGGITQEIEIGLYGFKTGVLTWGGETYIVNAIGEALEDEDRRDVYKIELVFPELPNTRLIKLTREKDTLTVRMSESPNQSVPERFLDSFTNAGGKIGFAMGLLEKKLGENFLQRKLYDIFNPTLLAISTSAFGWEDILLNENMLRREINSRAGGAVASLITKFLGSDSEEDGEGQKKEKRGGIFSFFTRRKSQNTKAENAAGAEEASISEDSLDAADTASEPTDDTE